jgi:exodeoxyribonuclease-3
LIDACRRLHPKGPQFTWWDYRQLAFPRDEGLRIDLILATLPVAGRLVRCEVERHERQGEKPSDHAPVITEWV